LDNCIFCKIIAGKIPSTLIYEDDDLVAFHDIHPAAPVHLLIVPKAHLETLAACDGKDAAILGKMLLLAPQLAQQHGCAYAAGVDGGAPSGGFKTLINTGPDGGQEVYHLHMHVIGGPKPWQGQR
jgi:histidine triad (HIT) family protein